MSWYPAPETDDEREERLRVPTGRAVTFTPRWQRMDSAIATLRHAYAQLASGRVVDQKAFAEGLIGRAIRELEQINNENT